MQRKRTYERYGKHNVCSERQLNTRYTCNRAEGEPAVNKSVPFADVKADMYYANTVIWAEQNGIVKGYSETEFAPDENITRAQSATIIYRYAKFKGVARQEHGQLHLTMRM